MSVKEKIMETVLVTGGAGYVGSILVPKLLAKGYQTIVLDTMFFTDIGLKAVKSHPQLTLIEGDIRSEKTLKSALKEVDAVIHLASISNDPSSDLNPQLTVEVNYDATLNLVRLAKESGAQRFINVSTSSVYGIKETPNVTEDLPLEPLTVYSKTKAEAEPFVQKANDKSFTALTIRPATVCGYSPKMRLDLTVNILTMHALTKGKITVFGGNQRRPNIHIEDITDYYVRLLEIPAEKIAGKTYNAGYENFTVLEIAQMVREIIGPSIQIEVTPTNDNRSYHISSAKIERELGLKPNKTIKDAVLDIKTARQNGLLDWENINFYNVKKMKMLVENQSVTVG
ncbi:MAG: NAD-dependent epimerase/dehydratase family protein [Elusimicrobia bacterium]|nr:NAD-dependent epimerase/dehydratase family protein [Elusimicrobiota bacterium]